MCGRTYARYGSGFGGRRAWGHHRWKRHGDFFGLDTENMSPRARTVAALAVLGPVALSGVILVVFVPQLWWIFTTYFWVAFPALGLLSSSVSVTGEDRSQRISEAEKERELLEAIRDGGEVSAAFVAARTSLSVAEADRRLKELAENGHIEVRARGGAVFYSLWGIGDGGARL
jgi:DNA-binding transcriptional ArsR family regulator